MFISPEELFKVLLAVIAGGLIGLEREFRDKAAGFRTLIFICVGSALFTLFSGELAGDKDPTRIAAQIVSGVGFLGAGVIMRESGRIVGITTAAAIWLTAAVGMGIGSGHYGLALLMTLVAVIVLWAFPLLEFKVDSIHEERTYEIVCQADLVKVELLERLIRQCNLRVRARKQTKRHEQMTCLWHLTGRDVDHQQLVQALFQDPALEEIRF